MVTSKLAETEISLHTDKPARTTKARSSQTGRVQQQCAFVLHSHVYSESSLLLDVFTRDYGRVGMIAKGARRPSSKLRGALQTFQMLSVDFSGRSQLRTLSSAEWMGGMVPLADGDLLYGFYLNELVIRLLAREDPHPGLFDAYVDALTQLAKTDMAESVLRMFELKLLKEIGVCPDLAIDSEQGTRVDAESIYVVDPEGGPRLAQLHDTSPRVTGKTLQAMLEEDYSDTATQQQSKLLMRHLLAHHLNGVPLQTRKILIDLMQF